MGGLVRQRERSVLRERVLTASGVALLAATSRDRIFDAARDAVRPLTDDETPFWLFAVEGAHVTLVATHGDRTADPSGDSMSDPTAAALMVAAARDASLVALIPEVVGIELGIATDSCAVVLPLAAGTEICGLLLVATESSLPPASRTALQALATQVSMALGSALLTEEIHRRTSEARFTSLVQRATDLITVLDANAVVVYQSPSIERVLGYAPEAIIGTRFDRLLVGGKETRLLHLLADGSVFGGGETQVVECSLTHSDGSQRDFEMLYTNLLDDDSVGGVVLNGRDISERKVFEHQLEHQAFHDPVTDLPNRALFNERVRHAVARARREEHGLAVIFVDLDDFKTVNDSLGHAAGDRVLNEVAKRLDTSIRASDTAARFGGDEFTVLLEGVQGPGEAAETAERIVESIGQPILLEQKEILLRASLGISVLEVGVVGDADELIRNADAAMYIAKRDGKGEYRLFEPAMHEEVLARLELRGDLQRALSDDQFELHYQPLIRLSDARVVGLEALIRWRHPERGLVQPGDFIPFAEETGLIVPIGRWVLREGCREARRMQDRAPADPPLSMSINLSVKQLHHSDIVGDVRDALAESGLDPETLTLEITETVMMTDADQAEQRLTELKALGVRLAMDDFGTGYSSLSYLSRFPVDVLKMDRSFLPAGELPVSSGLATAVLGLGETFNFEVLAEGIELTEQWTALRDLGFALGQGFYFAKPMDAAATLEYLQTSQSEHAVSSPGPSGDAT
jgi:diguanylate cyclase (GGDEF)-like protein/PAS domain S-box-containing protein